MVSLSSEEQFPISLCTPADIPQLHHVWEAAFSPNPAHQLMFPATIDPTIMTEWYTKRASAQMARPEIQVSKITDASTGKIAAFARWQFPHAKALASEEHEEEKTGDAKKSEWPAGSNAALCDEKFGMLDVWRDKYVDVESTYVAMLVVTSPDYQRKGLASRLMKAVLDLADAEGRKAYIEASPDGYPLYYKLGFRDLAFADVDMSLWGGQGVIRSIAMIREPVSKAII